MITEGQIQEVVAQLEEQALTFEEQLKNWMEWQPHVTSYLFSDSFHLLNQNEKEAFIFGSTVILTIARNESKVIDTIDEDEIGEREEANYELLESQGSKSLSGKMDVFFEHYPEEDLLAFIEDFCVDEEEEDFSDNGMEVMVVGLKTVVDVFFVDH